MVYPGLDPVPYGLVENMGHSIFGRGNYHRIFHGASSVHSSSGKVKKEYWGRYPEYLTLGLWRN